MKVYLIFKEGVKMKIKIIPIILIIFMVVIIFSGCFEDNSKQNTNTYTEYNKVRITEIKIDNKTFDRENIILFFPYVESPYDCKNYNLSLNVVNCSDVILAMAGLHDSNPFLSSPAGLTKIDNNHYWTNLTNCLPRDVYWDVCIAEGKYLGNGTLDKRIDAVDLIYYTGVNSSNITSLSITNVTFDVFDFDFNTNIVAVTADITSNVSFTRVKLHSFEISRGSNGGSSAIPAFVEANKSGITLKNDIGTHQWTTSINDNEVVSESDSKFYNAEVANYVFYRIFAEDEAGNIAVSPLYSFIHV